jgi:epoxyqueuosine reductase
VISTREIKQQAHRLGIDDIRITHAEPCAVDMQRFQTQKQAGLFTNRTHRHLQLIEKFYDVRATLDRARSVISACECYLTDENEDLSINGNPYGRIARYTWRNYYKDLRIRLKKLADYISSRIPHQYVVYANGPIAEKPLAQRSGLGYYGKHSILLHPQYGSWIVLGEIVTDLELEYDTPLSLDCGECVKCMEACPTGALKTPYMLDRNRCIQELTNWCGTISEDIMEVWDNRVYGCTTCQDVCPQNHTVQTHPPRTTIGEVGSCIPLFDLLAMSEKEYRDRYKDNQITASWIHFRAIKRNALIALGHAPSNKALALIEQYCRSSDAILTHAAKWARARTLNA